MEGGKSSFNWFPEKEFFLRKLSNKKKIATVTDFIIVHNCANHM